LAQTLVAFKRNSKIAVNAFDRASAPSLRANYRMESGHLTKLWPMALSFI